MPHTTGVGCLHVHVEMLEARSVAEKNGSDGRVGDFVSRVSVSGSRQGAFLRIER